ncbi:MAG TPA: hypothetical protein DCE42_22450 [Myxococcales bacterium]|nr:hypothetical protein [Deltaproteobacteria bacterium]HAA57544.1 hypothetical protein [Myxococcales bacterium]|tara:strand:+ start:822 stop:1022 length:201 start_codon:yes stop_codon:yes gene_type:complete
MSEQSKKTLTFKVSRKLAVAGFVATTALSGAYGCSDVVTNPIPQENPSSSDASTTDEPAKEAKTGE